jgi:membrane protease YdiL (CAAX protease family)
METTLNIAAAKPGLTSRLMAHPLVRIVLGVVLTFAAVPLTMIVASKLVEKPYRIVWPQLLAAVLVWLGYRFYVRRIEKRQPTELATRGMALELGKGLLLGAGLVASTFAVLAAFGAYRFDGVNAVNIMILVPLAELILVGMAEEMVFRGVIFGVTERSLGSKAAIGISALVFGLAHLPNEGVSALRWAPRCWASTSPSRSTHADFARLHRAHLDHHVLVFRDQRITPQQQVAFSRRFGPLQIHVLRQFQLPRIHPVLVVSNIRENGQPIGLGDAGHFWHSDLSYKDTPSLGSMLHAQELPEEGGDTLFANQHTGLGHLPARLRARRCRAAAEHSYLASYEELRKRNPWRPAHAGADRRGQAGRAPGGAHPSRDRPQGAVRQRAFHHPHRRPARRREPRAAGRTVRAQRAAGARLPPPLAAARHGVLGQPLVMHLAAGCPDHLRRKLYRTTIEGDAPF